MGAANMPEGMVKKDVMIIAVLVALAAGFLGGVIFSSFKSPQVPTTGVQGNAPQPAGGQQPMTAGPTPAQGAKIMNLEQEVKNNPRNVGAWTQLGNIYFDTNQPVKAIGAYRKSLELNESQPDVWTDLGVMYRSNRQFKEAIAAFERATSLQPSLEQALFNKGVVLMFDLGDKAGAIQAWQQVLAINPDAHAPNGQSIKDMIAAAK